MCTSSCWRYNRNAAVTAAVTRRCPDLRANCHLQVWHTPKIRAVVLFDGVFSLSDSAPYIGCLRRCTQGALHAQLLYGPSSRSHSLSSTYHLNWPGAAFNQLQGGKHSCRFPAKRFRSGSPVPPPAANSSEQALGCTQVVSTLACFLLLKAPCAHRAVIFLLLASATPPVTPPSQL